MRSGEEISNNLAFSAILKNDINLFQKALEDNKITNNDIINLFSLFDNYAHIKVLLTSLNIISVRPSVELLEYCFDPEKERSCPTKIMGLFCIRQPSINALVETDPHAPNGIVSSSNTDIQESIGPFTLNVMTLSLYS
jgi:hypothetical protein